LQNYPYAKYVTDVKFQPALRPQGRFAESKHYFSEKHKLYGFKVEVSVAYPGFAIMFSQHEPGSVSDFTIFNARLQHHQLALLKTTAEEILEDNGELHNEYSQY
jgi:hypothetical protein